jgi:membrane-associated phospholipid phosphatase
MLIYAVSVSVATVYGRYHYVPDVLAGFGVSLVAAGVCLLIRTRDRTLAASDIGV